MCVEVGGRGGGVINNVLLPKSAEVLVRKSRLDLETKVVTRMENLAHKPGRDTKSASPKHMYGHATLLPQMKPSKLQFIGARDIYQKPEGPYPPTFPAHL